MSEPSNAKIGTVTAIGVTVLCVLVTAGTEYAGALELRIGTFALVLLPLFFAFVITVAVNLSLSWRRPDVAPLVWSTAGKLLQLLTVVFVVRAGVVLGTSLPTIIEAGPAILVQSLGKTGTVLLAFPAALLLGFGRASIGATFSIGREPSIALVTERYGISGPEGSGVLATYISGTLFGSLFFSALAGVGSAIPLFGSTALAMACGVGSGGMTISCAGSLAHGSQDLPQDEILALATASDVLTYVTTVLLGTFVVLPVLERLYRAPAAARNRLESGDTAEAGPTVVPSSLVAGLAVTVLLLVTQGWRAAPGVLVLLVLAIGARLLGHRTGRFVPTVLWAALVGAVLTVPGLPWSPVMLRILSAVDLLTLATAVLACVGLSVTTRQLKILRTLSWRAVVVTLLVFAGSFFTSALLAQGALSLVGAAG
ncbi:DUF3100 domain-containing protein [Amycolatopsis azurea]|uniref:DUF3100 domain-containing protein n=1 Tax=Amycolatopsis azurea DSM 43854 TaxID=1238180 RepID=M2P0Y4_9PSEU|nr:DUF3100 domain-containing protein [Amycolatopsis azurea]EMD28709.1 hypothetical protein C791_8142 [Amycolatopsis azurea DSM 43854]OOC07840.1 hypothetical protein B0293_02810 [Amycolatopsis azurea DSM 43854]